MKACFRLKDPFRFISSTHEEGVQINRLRHEIFASPLTPDYTERVRDGKTKLLRPCCRELMLIQDLERILCSCILATVKWWNCAIFPKVPVSRFDVSNSFMCARQVRWVCIPGNSHCLCLLSHGSWLCYEEYHALVREMLCDWRTWGHSLSERRYIPMAPGARAFESVIDIPSYYSSGIA